MPELTIFATPKPCRDRFARIQANAVGSWAALGEAVEVLLIGDDEGAAALAAAHGARHHPSVACSPRGVPLLDDLWGIGQAAAQSATCVFANADLMFTDDLRPALDAVRAQLDGPFLVVGQRWDVPIEEDLDTTDPCWGAALRHRARHEGRQSSPLWVDWFAFPRGQYPTLPPFVVGRPGYDHWLVWHTLDRAIPVVDVSDVVTVVHQRHDYSHGGGHHDVWFGDDAQGNRRLVGDRAHMRHIGHATHRLDPQGGLEAARGTKYVLSRAHSRLAPVLERTARVRHRFGIDAELLQDLAARRTRR